ncbi:substrate-binding domain-containing protein [Paenibacillus dendritiformis]|uniref:Sugar ABC transporter periplasmic protein n=1 Tax=Paenibacillus dendritiformis C454 TaxID=1131935 RepID=H3SI20_9BACL|nr:substrate-binding domain-containing protein [Paenibacillus dendritiformis]EHQ61271.1 sugar ABC transporter periplasmic protein [Paenibacillus dendritiformis C454]CAH8772850.1 substrate-binding domain-containing protein [Paenibacillus dendritiformis]
MSDKRWAAVLGLLFLSFLYLLFQFMSSTYRNQELIRQWSETETGASSKPHVMLISQELDNPYWRMIEQGARDAANRLGIALEYVGPLRINTEEQTMLLEKAIAAKVDAILLQGIHSIAYTRLIDQAVAQGIPVITVDADSPDSKRLSYVGTDNYESGRRLGEIVAEAGRAFSDRPVTKIGVLIGSNLAENQTLRLDGFRSVISQHRSLQIVDVRVSNISRIEAAQKASEMLYLHPDIAIIVGMSALDGAGILQAAKSSGRDDLLIFGFDDIEETKQALARGEIEASIIQKPYRMGYDSVSIIHDVLEGRSAPAHHLMDTEILTKDGIRLE